MKESEIQSKIIKKLKANKAYVVKVVQATTKGVPDILACYKGQFIGIEVKKPDTKNNTTALQKHNLLNISAAGGWSMVMYEDSQVDTLLEEIDNDL
jgi:Holliday junction resolvase